MSTDLHLNYLNGAEGYAPAKALCIHCGKPWGEHWAPGAFCSIDESVTPESATRFTLPTETVNP